MEKKVGGQAQGNMERGHPAIRVSERCNKDNKLSLNCTKELIEDTSPGQ